MTESVLIVGAGLGLSASLARNVLKQGCMFRWLQEHQRRLRLSLMR